jgi:LAGLIDADG-like domain
VKSLNKVEKAYIAGIIDGEGTVTLTRKRPNETPSPNVSVANASLPLLIWAKKKIGGHISTKRKYKSHHRQTYVWCITHNKALRFLNEIKAFLIIKRPQAELILKDYKTLTMRTGKYTPAMLKAKMELVSKIRKLNQREFMPSIIRRTPIHLGEEIVHST